MSLTICPLRKKDYRQAIQYAVTGMHFDWYTDNKLLLALYGRYFWYMELCRATQIIAAYEGDVFAGVLLASMRGEKAAHRACLESIYVKLFKTLQSVFAKGGANVYDAANQEMLAEYRKTHTPDGEIVFLAANPDIQTKGVGSMLLQEFERREQGKTVYLYTDSGCTYQFYEHRGFTRVGEKDIVLRVTGKEVELRCMLYSKVLA